MELSPLIKEAAEIARQAIEQTFSGELPGEVNSGTHFEGALPGETAEAMERNALTGELPSGEIKPRIEMIVESTQVERVDLRAINSSLEGGRHSATEIPYHRREVGLPDGREVSGVFPEFNSHYEMPLPEDMYMKNDREQFDYCNEKLREAVESSPELRGRFDDMQFEQIRNNDTPDGFIWHHNEEPGRMQLVDEYEHSKSAHTGGRSLWGGGSAMRGAYTNGVPA